MQHLLKGRIERHYGQRLLVLKKRLNNHAADAGPYKPGKLSRVLRFATGIRQGLHDGAHVTNGDAFLKQGLKHLGDDPQ